MILSSSVRAGSASFHRFFFQSARCVTARYIGLFALWMRFCVSLFCVSLFCVTQASAQPVESGLLHVGGFRCASLKPLGNDPSLDLYRTGYWNYTGFRMEVWRRLGIPFWYRKTFHGLTIPEAHRLAVRVMAALGHDATDSALIADHLIDCEFADRLRRPRSRHQHRRADRTHGRPSPPHPHASRNPRLRPHRWWRPGRLSRRALCDEHRDRQGRGSGIAVVGPATPGTRACCLLRGDGGRSRTSEHDRVERVSVGRALRSDGGLTRHQPDLLRLPQRGRLRHFRHRHIGDHPRRGYSRGPARQRAARERRVRW